MTEDYGLAFAYANARLLRIADDPDEVHRNQIGKLESARHHGAESRTGGFATIAPREGSGWRSNPTWIA